MKLYNQDYTELTDTEKEEWYSLRQKERNTGATRLKGIKPCVYPKAVRHFNSIFPNNYLDSYDLKVQKPLMISQLDQFRNLIHSDDVTERDILNFINSQRAFFIIASLLEKYFSFGHHGSYLFPEFQLGNSYKVDYLLVGKCSDGWHFVLIELEAPLGNITLKDGGLGSAIRKGLSQITDWDAWLQARYSSLKETFDKYKRTDMCLPDEFFIFDNSRIQFIVIAGKRKDFNEKTYMIRRKNIKDSSTLILHYDNLIDAAENIFSKNNY